MTRRTSLLVLVLVLLALAVLAPAAALAGAIVHERGKASWYRADGGLTASGVRHGSEDLSAAHPSLPFGSRVVVTNLRNGRSVVLPITDRGPFTGGRVIDVSEAAARQLGFHRAGIANVRVEQAGR